MADRLEVPTEAVDALARERYEMEEGRWRDADEDEREEQREAARQLLGAIFRGSTAYAPLLTIEEATAVVAASFGEDHDTATFDAAIKRLGNAVDASLGLSSTPNEGRAT